jgi:hypothetical protein
MTPEPPDRAAGNSSTSIVREAFLSIFVLFYQLLAGLWPAQMNADAHKGVVGISVVELLFGLSIFNWLQIETGHQASFNRTIAAVILVLGFLANYYVLVVRRMGVMFVKEFNQFRIGKRVALRLIAVGLTAACVFMFYLSVTEFRRKFFPGS